MPRNGSGGMSLAEPPFVFNTIIDETALNSDLSDIAAEITNSLAADGQTTPTADLKMGGRKHINVGTGTARNHYASVGQVQDGGLVWGGLALGTANALIVNLTPAITALVTGQRFAFQAASANTAAATITVNGTTVALEFNDLALVAGDIEALKYYEGLYDGTAVQASRLSGEAAFELIDDPNPTLGADLQMGGFSIDFPTTANVGDVISSVTLTGAADTNLATALAVKTYVDNETPVPSLRREIFTVSGTWTRPAGVTIANIQAWGAGASGGGDVGDGGGGSGEYAEARTTGLAADVTVTIGPGGVGVLSGDGNSGGNSSFGAFVIANGGSANVGPVGGAGGTGGTGDTTINGGVGAPGNSINPGAPGGNAPFGGAGGIGPSSSLNTSSVPGFPGGGGGGIGSSVTSGGSVAGAIGAVIVEWLE